MSRNRLDNSTNSFIYFLFSSRSTTDPVPKQSTIGSISSNVPLMTTNTSNDAHLSGRGWANTTTTDVDSFLNSYKTNTSRRQTKDF
jgi:hypothetical protein